MSLPRQIAAVLATGFLLALPAGAGAASFEVTRGDDPPPDACVAGDCSLREAVLAAVSEPGEDDVVLRPGAAYELAIADGPGTGPLAPPGEEDQGRSGDLDVLDGQLKIAAKRGSGRKAGTPATIDANAVGRVLEVAPGGALRLTRVKLTGGLTPEGGGAVLARDKLTLSRVTIHANAAAEEGGGLSLREGNARIKGSTASRNSAGGAGGAIDVAAGAGLRAINTTLAGNAAGEDGGGIASAGILALNTLTVAYNVGDSDADGRGSGGGLASSTAGFVVENSLLASNRLGASIPSDCSGNFDSDGDNLVGALDPSGCTGFDFAGDLVDVAKPRIGRLRDNGGTTKTVAVKRKSPAIDEGGVRSSPRRDQRDVRRDELPDIGAYERETSRSK